MNLIVAGGGTGGHVFPGIAVAREFMKMSKENKVLYVGSKSGMEEDLVPEYGLELKVLPLGGIMRKNLFLKIINIFKIFKATFSSMKMIDNFKPDVLLGVGGYASYPTILAARLKGCPAAVLEQNTVAGLANRVLGLLASRVYTAFKFSEVYFRRKKVLYTGNPLRSEILDIAGKEKPGGPFTIFVYGGSQGASKINHSFIDALEMIKDIRDEMRFVHQTGKLDYDFVKEAYQKASLKADVFEFRNDISQCLNGADLIVSRSGSGICEIAAAGRASILIPYPNSSYDHQDINAKWMVDAGAAIKIDNGALDGEILSENIRELYNDRDRLRQMAVNASSLAMLDAAGKIAQDLSQLVGEK